MRWTEILVEEMLADLLAGLMKLSGGKMETNVLKITYLHSVHAIALSLLALDQGAPVVQIFFQIKNTRSHTIVL